MGTPATAKRKRVAKPPEERRKDILDAAAQVFARKGIADARIEEITTLAEVSKGTFYLYFKTKGEAAAALWERHMDDFAGVGEEILGNAHAPLAKRLVDVLESLCRFALDHADLHRVLYDGAGAQAVHAAANERLIGMIAAAAKEGIKTGDVTCEHPDMTARALFHGFCGAVTDAITGFAPLSHEEVVTASGHMTRAVFGLKETGSG
ncbi:TetR/AcrR family transcriptional regulator [Streptomyces sp. LRE541]|uniref:TetR/AcrR family transcriptional regulator n=1 Tax=Streptomyces sp. LRE541 TaxID=2931983 RepID=UPI00200F2D78|nr:TetR/AcrR family transcriptional regulator [Streptomyces sp. LRE541]UPZ26641.1 TetR/AcrR family transcriptional regulator [Streptomyces sp. LRE541]